MQTVNQEKQLIYVADPMCSWCYGFAPAIDAIADAFQERLPISLLMGGLRAGNRKAMTAADRDTIREHWKRVEAASGQPFDYGFFEREGFVYDTEPACRAVVTMRILNEPLALPYMHRIQHAFYADGRDTTDSEALAELADGMGVDGAAFLTEMRSAEARNATLKDFVTAQESGITGFPTLFAGPTEKGYVIVTQGYRPLEGIVDALELWLAGSEPQH